MTVSIIGLLALAVACFALGFAVALVLCLRLLP